MADDKSKEATDAEAPVVVHSEPVPTRGAQVIVTGDAAVAARGGYGSIEENTIVKKALEADGTVADGSTPDGSTLTGKPAADVVSTTEAEPAGEVPAAEGTTRVEVEEPAPEPDAKRKPGRPKKDA